MRSDMKEVVENGSMMPATGKALLTGIRKRRRSSTEGLPRKQFGRERPSAGVPSREDRTCPGTVGTDPPDQVECRQETGKHQGWTGEMLVRQRTERLQE